MDRLKIYIIILISLILGFLIENSVLANRLIVLTNGTLIDGTGVEPIFETTVVIEGDRILAIQNSSAVNIPANSKVIDATGDTILPGFVNAHIHTGFHKNILKRFARNGVTTVRDLGGVPRYFLKEGLAQDDDVARLVAAGPMLTEPKGYPPGPYRFEIFTVTDAVRETVQLIEDGASVIKIMVEDYLRGRAWPLLTKDKIEAIVNTAHNLKVPVSAHAVRFRNLKIAVDAGVDDIAHIILDHLPDNYIKRMVQQDIYWVPTLEVFKCVVNSGRMRQDYLYGTAFNNLERFVVAGGKVALGTDFNGYDCIFDSGMPITEMELMQQAGMSPMQIIVAATKHAAHVCNLEHEVGTIEVGKFADIIIVDGNPLEDINVLVNVRAVIHNGKLIYSKN